MFGPWGGARYSRGGRTLLMNRNFFRCRYQAATIFYQCGRDGRFAALPFGHGLCYVRAYSEASFAINGA